ncbi:hypothetical protein JD969_02450 [Planctomycetota bacterium]|nr:hypothetical protein JD969_02450 [Planctomycetota bacterium]
MSRKFFSSIKPIFLSPIAPSYALSHANSIPFIFTFIFALLASIIAAPLIQAANNAYQIQTLAEAIRLLVRHVQFLFTAESYINPPALFLTIAYTLAMLLLAFLLTPRAAVPYQNLRQAYRISVKHFTIITPALYLTIIALLFFSNFTRFYQSYQVHQNLQQWQQQHPHPRQQRITQNPTKTVITNDTTLQQQTNAWMIRRNEAERTFEKSSAYTRAYTIGSFIGVNGCILASLFFLMIFRAFATQKQLQYKPQSRWPAICESCSYHIFSIKTNDSQHPEPTCPECGHPISSSLNPIHRIDDPFTSAATFKQKTFAPFKLAFLFLFKPSKLANQLQPHTSSFKHHQLARLAFYSIPILTFIALTCGYAASHPNLSFLYEINNRFGFYNYFYFEAYSLTIISLIFTYLLIQIIAFMNALTLSLLYRKANPYFAIKLANLTAPAIILLAFSLTLLSNIIFRVYLALPTDFTNALPFQLSNLFFFRRILWLTFTLLGLLYILSNTIRILRKTRFTNI